MNLDEDDSRLLEYCGQNNDHDDLMKDTTMDTFEHMDDDEMIKIDFDHQENREAKNTPDIRSEEVKHTLKLN